MISKSGYVNYWKCPKLFWLHLYKPNEEELPDDNAKFRMSEGNRVGELARSYFPDTHNAEVRGKDGKLIYEKQIQNTKEFLDKNVNCIAEASFSYNELFCAVDLLKKDDNGGYSIYEVKCSSNLDDKQYYCVDAIFQKYVLEKCGLKINNVYILHPNKEYIRHGKIDLDKYFIAENVFELKKGKWAKNALKNIDLKIKDAISIYNKKNIEPKTPFCKNCNNKIKCSFYKYCHRDMPSNCVSNLYKVKSDAEDFYNNGIITIEDYIKAGLCSDDERQRVQIDAYLNKKDKIIDKLLLKEFLSQLKYPIYHIDFETSSSAIPEFDGMNPWGSYPFQYSIHIQYEDGSFKTKSFLGDKLNCRRELAESLVKDIPVNSCVMSFNAPTETGEIKKLARLFPDLADHLYNISNNVIDLLYPFKMGFYYDSKQLGSNSIKEVLPALCPEMEKAYKSLPVVHEGQGASNMFKKLVNEYKGTELYKPTREGMLAYCNLDTFAMVKVLKVLLDATK